MSNNSGPDEATRVRQVMDEFRTAYADAVIKNMTDAQFWAATRTRQLTWTSPHRLSLADAVRCYKQLWHSYNRFRPALLRRLLKAFPERNIEVTPARELSVAVYLHVPDVGDLRSQVETFACERFKADTVQWTEPGILRCWWD